MEAPKRLRPAGRLGWAKLVTLAICIGFGVAVVIANVRSWELEDADAYWNAAMRLRDGQPLYIAVPANADEMLAYRYAPWLAWVWVPLTYLPKSLVLAAWSVILIAAVVVAVLPTARVRSTAAICITALLGALLVRSASSGNVHALLVAGLVWGIPRRSGPLWIALAASLKLLPILFVLPLLGRRQWVRAAIAVLLTAVLLAPIALYDLSAYPIEAGESLSILSNLGPMPYVVVGVCAAAAAIVLARGRYAWLAATTALVALTPRLNFYDLTYYLVPSSEAPRPPTLLRG